MPLKAPHYLFQGHRFKGTAAVGEIVPGPPAKPHNDLFRLLAVLDGY